MRLKALMVGQNVPTKERLTELINSSTIEIEILAFERNALAGIKAIIHLKPDLVFFAIPSSKKNHLNLLELIDFQNCELIVTSDDTAHTELALNIGASGYLVSSINEETLRSALEKVVRSIKHKKVGTRLSDGKSYFYDKEEGIVVLPYVGGLYKVSLKEILYIEAMGRQVKIVLENEVKAVINLNLKTILDIFDKSIFIRIHKSFIVNFIHVKRFRKGKDSTITLYNDIILNVGKVYKEELSQIIDHLAK